MIEVVLTADEVVRYQAEGKRRLRENRARRLRSRFGAKDEIDAHETGTGGEMAAWNWLHPDRPWEPATMGMGDVPPFQVRCSRLKDGFRPELMHLILRPGDDEAGAFLLALMVSPSRFLLAGWYEGRFKYLPARDPGGRSPSWWIPPHMLRPVEAAGEIINRRPA